MGSSGSTASGSWGSQLPIWLWILLICLCCCCHGGGIGAMMGGKGKPKKKKTKKVAPASTTLAKAVAKGATKMNVASDAGFKIGDMIDVGPGTPEHEVNTVKAFGSIICATPLQNDHPAGTVVAKAANPAAPAPVPAPAMEPVAEPLLPAVPPLMPLATTSQLIPSYSMVATPQQSYTYAAPATTSYVTAPQQSYTYAAPATTSYAAAPVASYGYAAPATTSYAATATYASPAVGGYAY